MLKALFFDADNTIFDNHKCAEFYLKYSCDKIGISYSQAFYDTYFEINSKLWKEVEEGKRLREEVKRIRLQLVFERLNIQGDFVLAEAYLIEGLRLSHDLVEGAKEVLEKLSPYYKIYMASNSSPTQQQHRASLAGIDKYFSGFFISGELGAEKPTKAFYERAFAQLDGLKPCECMMIGDSLRADITGGNAFGMRTCWFDYYHNGGDFPSAKPNFTINYFSELLDLLLPDGKYFANTKSVLDCSDTLIKKNLKAYEELS